MASENDSTLPETFICNLCGQTNSMSTLWECGPNDLREAKSCAGCGSSVRTRSIISLLSTELFGVRLGLKDFPTLKGVRGLGLSDSEDYAPQLAQKFNYVNTHFDREPKLDITDTSSWAERNYDFVIASEVFEHVAPPALDAFTNAAQLVADAGFLLLSVPFSLEETTREHFSSLHDYSIVTLRNSYLLVNRSSTGALQVFDDVKFHGGHGATLEVRFFSECSLKSTLLEAGFSEVVVGEPQFFPSGILYPGQWSLPMIARKKPQSARHPWMNEIVTQLAEARRLCRLQDQDIANLSTEIARLRAESQERLDWGFSLQTQLDSSHARARQMDLELEERLVWVRSLEEKLHERHKQFLDLQDELTDRTKWAQSLDIRISQLEAALSAVDLRASALNEEVTRLNKQLAETSQATWTRIGRKLRLVP